VSFQVFDDAYPTEGIDGIRANKSLIGLVVDEAVGIGSGVAGRVAAAAHVGTDFVKPQS